MGGKANASGYLLSHDDSGSSGFGSLPGNHNISPLNMKSEGGIHELVSPRVSLENHGMLVQSGHAFRPNWPVMNSMERQNMIQNVEEKVDHSKNNMTNLSLQGKKCANIINSSMPIFLSPHVDVGCMQNVIVHQGDCIMSVSGPKIIHFQLTHLGGPTSMLLYKRDSYQDY